MFYWHVSRSISEYKGYERLFYNHIFQSAKAKEGCFFTDAFLEAIQSAKAKKRYTVKSPKALQSAKAKKGCFTEPRLPKP